MVYELSTSKSKMKGLNCMGEETLLVVDDNDNFSEYATRTECHTGDGRHHRAFVLLLYNKDKQILLQKRKSKLWNGYWDITGASHVLHVNGRNETYEEAAQRCSRVEWGITTKMTKILGFNYFERFNSGCENEYCALIIGEINGELKPNNNHVHEHKWTTLKELTDDIIQQAAKHFTPKFVSDYKYSAEYKEQTTKVFFTDFLLICLEISGVYFSSIFLI